MDHCGPVGLEWARAGGAACLLEAGANYRLWRPENEAEAVRELSEGRVVA